MSAALASSPLAKRTGSREPAALETREVDHLVSKLLAEIKVPFDSLGPRVLNQLSDLKKILSADYVDVPALPSKPLLRELAKIVENDIKQHMPALPSMPLLRELEQIVENDVTQHIPASDGLASLGSPQLLRHLGKIFGPREVALRAEPYRAGAGLALRGFYCRAKLGDKSKFVIFVNTAHHPGAVAATSAMNWATTSTARWSEKKPPTRHSWKARSPTICSKRMNCLPTVWSRSRLTARN